MNKMCLLFLCVLITVSITSCEKKAKIKEIVSGNYKTYEIMTDNTYVCEGITYKYRLEVSGKIKDASKNSTFVYLSNVEEISFERAWKAAGLSSHSADYFQAEEAVLVEWR